MKNYQPLLLAFLLIFSKSLLNASDLDLSKEPVPFINIPVGARITAMGGAGAAVMPSNNASTHINPALGTLLEAQNITMTSALLDFDRYFYHAGYSIPFLWNIKNGFRRLEVAGEDINNRANWHQWFTPTANHIMTLGFSGTMFGVKEIEGRSSFGQREPDFQDIERAYNVNYGWRFYENFALGFNVKIINQSVHTAVSSGVGVDTGFWYGVPKFKWGKFDIGLVFKDWVGEIEWEVSDSTLGSTFKFKEAIPVKNILGLAYQSSSEKFTLAIDAVKVDQQNMRAHTGLEYAINPSFFLRAGANAYDPTAGVGVIIPIGETHATLDYSFQYSIEELDNPHWLTLSFKWRAMRNITKDQRRQI